MDTAAKPLTNPQEEKIKWNSPIFIVSILVALGTIIFGLFLFLNRLNPQEEEPELAGGVEYFAPGAAIDQQEAVEAVSSLATTTPQSLLLVQSTLRTTYDGLLKDWYTQEGTTPDDVVLILELNRGTDATTVRFEFTNAQIDRTRVFMIDNGVTTPIAYNQLEVGNGVAITYIKDLRDSATRADDEIIIEATRQNFQ